VVTRRHEASPQSTFPIRIGCQVADAVALEIALAAIFSGVLHIVGDWGAERESSLPANGIDGGSWIDFVASRITNRVSARFANLDPDIEGPIDRSVIEIIVTGRAGDQ
jgi:hypothetical protein